MDNEKTLEDAQNLYADQIVGLTQDLMDMADALAQVRRLVRQEAQAMRQSFELPGKKSLKTGDDA